MPSSTSKSYDGKDKHAEKTKAQNRYHDIGGKRHPGYTRLDTIKSVIHLFFKVFHSTPPVSGNVSGVGIGVATDTSGIGSSCVGGCGVGSGGSSRCFFLVGIGVGV